LSSNTTCRPLHASAGADANAIATRTLVTNLNAITLSRRFVPHRGKANRTS
jgi:hypothetical protein